MAFAESLATAIALAPGRDLDHLAHQLWQAFDNGTIGDDDAQAAAEAIEARRAETRPKPRLAASGAPRAAARRRQRSPDRAASIERRRRLAASGPMPPALAARFTQGELACLKVVADAVKHRGRCDLCMDEIAGRSGVCRRTAQNAIRHAERLGLLAVQERRLSAFRNDTNIIVVIDAAWRAWLRLADKGGCKTLPSTPHKWKSRSVSAFGYRFKKRLGEVAKRDPGG